MKTSKLVLFCAIVASLLGTSLSWGQPLQFSKKDMVRHTPEWRGERFSDGRPKVSDGILERMKEVAIEEAWSVLRNAGYESQFERGWKRTNEEGVLVGRALTVTYMPRRSGMNEVIDEIGKKEGRVGNQVSWPIDMLVMGDVYVADVHDQEVGGPIIGGNLATAIMKNSGNGVVFDGEIRDREQIAKIEGFNAFVRDWNPSYYWASMIMGINTPTRIGRVTVMPGDVVLGRPDGVIFIPPHLAEKVVKTSELVRLRDAFGFERLRSGTYLPGEVDGRWTDKIEKDFSGWLEEHIDELPIPREQIQELLKERTW